MKEMEVEWIFESDWYGRTCTEMTIAILGDAEKRGCVVTAFSSVTFKLWSNMSELPFT